MESIQPAAADHPKVEGTALVAGATPQVTGRLAFSGTGLSFWGGVDPVTGVVIDERHPLCGRVITDSILAIPSGRGSCTASQIVLELVLNGTAPKAIVLRDRDAVVAVGALVAREFFDASPPLILARADFDALESLDGEIVSVATHDAPLPRPHLTEADQAALDGSNGPAVQRAMNIVVETAKIQGASQLVDVAAAHIDACTYVGPGGLAFAEKLVELGGHVRVLTTTNSCSVDRSNWRRLGVADALGEPASRVADAYVALGCAPSFTCAPVWKSTSRRWRMNVDSTQVRAVPPGLGALKIHTCGLGREQRRRLRQFCPRGEDAEIC